MVGLGGFMVYRVLGAAFIVPLLMLTSWLGSIYWSFLVGIIIALGIWEYGQLVEKKGYEIPVASLAVLGFFLAQCAFIDSRMGMWQEINGRMIGFAVLCAMLWILVWGLWKKKDVSLWAVSLFGFLWVGGGLCHLIFLQGLNWGDVYFAWLAIFITWATDTGAFVVGSWIGKNKMAPNISPNKTWEGCIGGVLFCLFIIFFYNLWFLHLPTFAMLAIGCIGSILDQVGDLVESYLKRWAGVKDSGKLIPGHGGILDRFDSLILVAPVVYYLVTLIL